MTYNFLSPPNRFKPREFKKNFQGSSITYSLQPKRCLTELKVTGIPCAKWGST